MSISNHPRVILRKWASVESVERMVFIVDHWYISCFQNQDLIITVVFSSVAVFVSVGVARVSVARVPGWVLFDKEPKFGNELKSIQRHNLSNLLTYP